MIKEREQLINNFFGIFDVAISLLSFYLAIIIRNFITEPPVIVTQEYLILALIIIPVWFLLFKTANIARIYRTKRYSAIFLEYTKVIGIGVGILFLAIFTLKLYDISRGAIFLFGPLNLVLLFSSRIILFRIMKHFRTKGANTRNVVVIADDSAESFLYKLFDNKEWGYNVKYIISDSSNIHRKFKDRTTVKPEKLSIRNLLATEIIDEVIYCKNDINQTKLRSIVYDCEEVGVIFRMQSQLFHMSATKAHLSHFGDTPFLTFMNTPSDLLALKLKRVISFLASLAILIIWSPVILAISVIIKLTSKGPVFFKQERVGLRGRRFYMYKFRTMVQNAEELKAQLMDANEADGPAFKIKDDPRITKVGKFLRKTGLDELPQFYNILIGDMTLVGPRPPIPEEVKQYENWQLRRLSMPPGLTCTWQIKPDRNKISFEEWMKLDLQYIDNWSNKLDIILFLKTIRTVLKGSGQ